MTKFFSKDKQPFILFDFVFWILLSVIFPAISGNFSAGNILLICLYLSAVYYAGELLLGKIDAIIEVPFLFKSGIYIICGSVACGLVFLFLPYSIILYGLAFIFLMDLVVSKRIVLSFSLSNFLCLIPFFVILFQTYELAYATTERYNRQDGDYFFYTAIVESIKTNHSLSNAVYHSGIPINYMSLPFVGPAHLAAFSGISSQFALWGVFSKLVPIVCYGTISYTVVKLYEILFKPLLTPNSFPRKQLLVAFMLLFLGPLHFLNLAKFDFRNTLFLGEGYVLPIGSPGFALSMLFAGLVLLISFSKSRYTVSEKLALIISLSIITASKVALLLPLGVLLGALSILWLFKKQIGLFITLLIALPVCIVTYKLTLAATDSIAVVEFTRNGYYFDLFGNLAGKYGITGGSAGKKVFLMMIITVLMWLSIKLMIFVVSWFSLLKNNYKAITLIVASIIAFIISMLPGFFINVYGRDGKGVFLFDGRFDMAQFVRADIFLLTIVSLVFALYLVYDHKNYFVRKGALSIVCFWMLAISFSFFANDYKRAPPTDQSWYKEVQQEFFKKKPVLMAMLGNGIHSGQTLTTAGVHPWFCTGIRVNNEGIVFTKTAYERNIAFMGIFNPGINKEKRKMVADSIRQLGVDCIVASPTSIHAISVAIADSTISPIPGTKWLYKFN
ncbi:MAG: hypothetical protein ABIN67_02020 [Ferruginibacter sp.]